MKKILFVAYGGGHINIINLIATKILQEKEIEFKILALTTGYNVVAEKYPQGIIKKVSDYRKLFQKDLNQIEVYGLELLEENYNINSGISKEDTIIYLGLSMFDLVNKYGEEEAKRLYYAKKRQAFLPVQTMKRILEYENIDIVVSTTSPRFEQASLIAGNELHIETVEILDLFGDLNPLPEAKHIVCMNKNIENDLKKRGLINKQYYHYGQPAIEASVNKILSLNKAGLLKKINCKNKNKILLYASQLPIRYNAEGEDISRVDYSIINNDIFDILVKINKKYGINIIFRIHPNENYENYKKYFDQYSFILYANDKLNLQESIAISDAIVTPYSTVGVEAIAASKDVFTYKSDYSQFYPVKSMMKEPFIFSNSFEELEVNLIKYFTTQNKTEKKKNFLPRNSVDNIIKLIKEI